MLYGPKGMAPSFQSKKKTILITEKSQTGANLLHKQIQQNFSSFNAYICAVS